MRPFFLYRIAWTFLCVFLFNAGTHAQGRWGSFFSNVPAKGYEGKPFRLQVDMRAVVEDDIASARFWVRVDKAEGTGYFNNMWKRPVRSDKWQTYTIDGKIDSAATRISFGALTELNGKFYYDNIKLSVETTAGKWETIYSTGFEKDLAGWTEGTGLGQSGVNKLYKTSIQADALAGSKVLLVEGTEIPNFGNDKKAGKFADVNGIKLYYEVYGQGQPLVVLHGNGGSSGSAASHMPELIKKYKVIAIDSRAQGKSGDTDKPLTYDQMAADVNELLNQLNIDSAFIWGQSDGAILCLVMAMDYPKKVKRVVAYAPNTVPDSSAIFGWAVTAVNRTIKNSKDPKEVKLYEMMRDYPNIPYEKLGTIKAPCLIMGGDRDVIRPEHLVKMFQSIPNSQLCILPGATHGGAWEQQERFLSIMNDFFLKPFRMPTTEDWFKE